MKAKNMDSLSNRELEILRLISAGSSDREIAVKLYLSVNTVKWHNRQIYAKLGVTSRAQASTLASEKGLLVEKPQTQKPTYQVKKHNLPAQISSFVGREAEIDKIKKLLKTHRLVTLTGPGGVGKTRLALETARTFLEEDDYPDGIYLIELAPVLRLERVAREVIEALKLSPPPDESPYDSLTRFLRDRRALLFLDNFEHLLEAAPLVSELLSAAPGLQILCTSREALHLTGEQLYPVQPLAIDPSQQLFIERVGEVNPAFDPGEDELILIANICARLDHLPLAIELAAARMNIFSLENLLDRLEYRFQVLKNTRRDSEERHQTLWDAIDWSYDLLNEEEQILFRRLAVFQGSRSIDAVEDVCCFDLEMDVLEGLASLLAKNLTRQEEGLDGQSRFYLLETIHKYSWVKLRQSGEEEAICRRHAEFFVNLVEDAKYPTRGGPNQIRWLLHLDVERRNLRVMYDWAITGGDVELGLRLVGSLDYFWFRTGYHTESKELVVRALDEINDAPAAVKAGVYSSAGMVYLLHQERILSKQMYHKALELYKELGNRREIGWTHILLMNTSEGISSEDAELRENFRKGTDLLRKIGDNVGIAQALTILGCHEENLTYARTIIEESLAIARDIGDEIREVINLYNLGYIQLEEGFAESSQEYFKESLKLEVKLGYIKDWSAARIRAIAGVALALDQPDRAAVLYGAADNMFKRRGLYPRADEVSSYQNKLAAIREKLDKKAYEDAWAEGQNMTPDEAIAFALEEDLPT